MVYLLLETQRERERGNGEYKRGIVNEKEVQNTVILKARARAHV